MISTPLTGRSLRNALSIAVFLAVAAAHSAAGAAELAFGRIITENDRRYLELSVHSYQGPEILEAVKRGIEARVFFTVQVVREGMMDVIYTRVLHSGTLRRSLRYDFWNRSYVITEGGKKTQYHNENTMFAHLFRVSRMEVPGTPPRDGEYRVRARAELKSVELYFPMNYIFKYIVGYWDFDTGWVNGPILPVPR